MTLDFALLIGAVVLLAAVFAARLGALLGLPSLLLFLGVGMMLGELGIEFNDAGLAHALGFAALVLILVEGGFTTRWVDIRGSLRLATLLATVGVGVSVGLMTLFGMYVLGLDLATAVLLGAIVSPTDSAAVFSVLRNVPLPARVKAILEGESGLNDAPIVLLVAMATAWAVEGEPPGGPFMMLGLILLELVVGIVLGIVVGFLGMYAMRSIALPASGLYPLAALGWAILAYGTGTWMHVSGFAAVYVCAMILGNAALPHRGATRSFAEGIGWIAQIGLFVMLGLLADPITVTWRTAGMGIAAGLVLTFIVRPISVFVCAVWFRVPWREQLFVSWAGLRGAVPIIMATVPLASPLPQASTLFEVVFVFVVAFTVLQAPTLTWVGRKLGVARGDDPTDIEVEVAPLNKIQADFMSITVPPGSLLHGVTMRELRLPKNSVVSLIIRDGEPFAPGGMDIIRTGDELLVVTPSVDRFRVERRFKQIGAQGRLARWHEQD